MVSIIGLIGHLTRLTFCQVKAKSILWILIQGLSCYIFLFQDFCYDHMTSQSLHICFLVNHSCNFIWIACVTSYFTLSGASFCSFVWLCFCSHVTYLTLENDFLTLKLTFFTLIQTYMVKWVYITLIEDDLRAANKNSNKLYRFLIEI